MKKIVRYTCLVMALTLALVACKKEEKTPTDTPTPALIGTWMQLNATYKAWENDVYKEDTINFKTDSSLYTINADNSYSLRRNDTILQSGTYRVIGNMLITSHTIIGYALNDTNMFLLNGNNLKLTTSSSYTLSGKLNKYEFIKNYIKK